MIALSEFVFQHLKCQELKREWYSDSQATSGATALGDNETSRWSLSYTYTSRSMELQLITVAAELLDGSL
jgi:hypothetical protein